MTELALSRFQADLMGQLGGTSTRRLVGEGGMGKVYEAEERLSKRRVALKVLHSELSKSDHARRLFMNEMQILAHLEHPNVVRSLASIEVGGELVMVLEFLEGRTLRAVISDRARLPWAEAVTIVARVASALAAAHGQNPPIIHRDLKPENIMVLRDGSIKVMDFGIAKVVEAMNQTNTQSVGTLQYMSPEQIDAHTIDHRSDLYCLGLILYELLEGRPPFTSSSPRQLLNRQCTATPPPLSSAVREGLPGGVEDLLFELLEKAPEDRPYLAEDVVERLTPFLPSPARATSTPSARGASSTAAPSPRAARSVVDAPASLPASAPKRAGASPSARDSSAPQATREQEEEEEVRPPAPRADTIALIERGDKPRDVPTYVAVAIIVALSLAAGLAAYLLRSSQTPAPVVSASAQPSASGAASQRAAPSLTGRRIK
ncbi:MAG: protein kinase [Polyangiaceae bacterium]